MATAFRATSLPTLPQAVPETDLTRRPQTQRRWTFDSLFRYSPGLVLITIAIADAIRIADPDLWGHLRFGQNVLRLHHLVLRDPFSYSAPGHLWNNHEWLTEVLMAVSFNHLGVFGLVAMKLACTAAMVIFLALAVAETDAPPLVQFGVLLYCAVVVKPQLQFRPQMFTFALLAGVIWLLTRDTYRRTGKVWIAVPILALWANLHGGFIMGIAALVIYAAVAGAQDLLAGRGWRRELELTGISIAAALATLATPYGINIWKAVAHALRDPYTRSVITEWQPLGSELINQWRGHGPRISNYEIGTVLIAATAVSWLLTIEVLDLPLVAIAAVMALSAFVSKRNLPIAAIALAAPLARHFARALWRPRIPEVPAVRKRAWWINQGVLVILSAFIFVQSGLFSASLTSTHPYPVSTCAFMKQHRLSGNILADYSWGEYLIWHMAPDSKVFIDGRYDTVYPVHTIYEFSLFNLDLPGAGKVLDHYPHDFVLISPDSRSRKLMDAREDWKLIYRDNAALLYARTNSAAARIPGVPVRGRAALVSFP